MLKQETFCFFTCRDVMRVDVLLFRKSVVVSVFFSIFVGVFFALLFLVFWCKTNVYIA